MTGLALNGHKILGDACAWIFVDAKGKLIGVACCHVDDFILAGNSYDKQWLSIKNHIKEMYKWGSWKSGLLRFAGIDIQQDAHYEITIDQEHYAEQLEDIDVDPNRLRLVKEKMTPREISASRAALGALQWLGVQTCLMLCARVGLLLSRCKAVMHYCRLPWTSSLLLKRPAATSPNYASSTFLLPTAIGAKLYSQPTATHPT